MSKNYWIGAATVLVVLLLIFLIRPGDRPGDLETGTSAYDKVAQEESRESNSYFDREHEPDSRTRLPIEDCHSCPDIKRDGMTEYRYSFQTCAEFLAAAAEVGNPNPDTRDLGGCEGVQPIHFARTPDAVRRLLEAGADPNARDNRGRTPLHHVLRLRNIDQAVVTELLDAGADPDLRDDLGRDANLVVATRPDLRQSTQAFQIMRHELDAERLGVTIEEYYEIYPRRRAMVESYSPGDDSADIRLQVQLMKAGSRGRHIRSALQLPPEERTAFLRQVIERGPEQ